MAEPKRMRGDKKIKTTKRLTDPDNPSVNRNDDRRRRLRGDYLGEGLPSVSKLHSELLDMTDVLMGREDPPVWSGPLTLMEVADSYYARAAEMTMLIQKLERTGSVSKGEPLYQFRTGELRTFMEMSKRAADLGSRRLTKESLRFEQSKTGRESRGFIENDD